MPPMMNQRTTTFKPRAQRKYDMIRRHQGENVCLKRGQKRSKSEKQARKEPRGKEEQWILKRRIKQIQVKNESKCSGISFMHNHTLHVILHQIFVFLSKTGIQSEKKVLDPTKVSKRPSGRKKVIRTYRSFQRILNPNEASDTINQAQLDAYWI